MTAQLKKSLRRVFIGHRGVGKSSLLQRHKNYFPTVPHFDLDTEIEKSESLKISEIFNNFGEAKFRELELQVFNRILSNYGEFVVALGAGFTVEQLPENLEVVFVSRETDKDGRIFLNRPRLDNEMSPLVEYQHCYNERNPKFLKMASWIYHLPEGIPVDSKIETKIMTSEFTTSNSWATLSKSNSKSVEIDFWKTFQRIEIRSDLFAAVEMESILKSYPGREFLVSVRTQGFEPPTGNFKMDCDVDYIEQNGTDPRLKVISTHEESISEGLSKINMYTKFFVHRTDLWFKLCPMVKTFDELRAGFEWQQQDPKRRSFLPRSADGRWVWFRQLACYFQALNFIRTSDDVKDQPTLTDWLSLPELQPNGWGAVLGEPVHFSRSPSLHREFFEQRDSFYSRICLNDREFEQNILFLKSIGLRYGSVTSPIKESLFRIADEATEAAKTLHSANTFFMKGDQICVDNTDAEGFKKLVEPVKDHHKVIIWGGGGTLAMMKTILPWSKLYSSQTGEARHNQEKISSEAKVDYLIWAAPRKMSTQFPSSEMKIENVIDLNYTESSMGIELAQMRGINYTDGYNMLVAQGLAQQAYWAAEEKA